MDTTVISEGLKPVFPETASLWDRAIGDVFICFVGFCSSEEPPPGSYHELEKESQFADQKFVGGIQACVIVRYHQSPIGEYDELLWIPGAFKLPTCGKRTYRATRAYVSTPLAVYSGLCTNVLALVDILLQHAKTIYNSGRKNWNVPKACAYFEFTPSQTDHLPYSRIKVSPYKGGQPFIDLIMQPRFLGSKPFLPVNSKYIPISLDFDFPPLPENKDCISEGLIGTWKWRRVRLEIAGKAGMLKVNGKFGDGVLFPCLEKMVFWIWSKGATIRIEGRPVP